MVSAPIGAILIFPVALTLDLFTCSRFYKGYIDSMSFTAWAPFNKDIQKASIVKELNRLIKLLLLNKFLSFSARLVGSDPFLNNIKEAIDTFKSKNLRDLVYYSEHISPILFKELRRQILSCSSCIIKDLLILFSNVFFSNYQTQGQS